MFPVKKERRLAPTQVTIESAGNTYRHHLVTLRGEESIDWVVSSPACWAVVQNNPNVALRRGDEVSIISPDGLTRADRLPVLRAETGVWLGKPLRIVTYEAVALFEDAIFEVVPIGTNFALKRKRDGTLESRVHATVEAAKADMARRAPKKIVA